jgi:trehalose-6-phosphate synthase
LRLLLRFAIPLLAVLAVLAAALTPVVDSLVGSWLRQDLRVRSRLIFNSLDGSLPELIASGEGQQIKRLFNRIAQSEDILAVGWCSNAGKLAASSDDWPSEIQCRRFLPSESVVFQNQRWDHGRLLYAGFPMVSGSTRVGQLVILNDLSFVAGRSFEGRLYLWALLAVLGLGIAAVTILTARITLRGWITSLRGVLNDPRPIMERPQNDDPQIAQFLGEIRQLLRDLDISRRTATAIRTDEAAQTHWSPEMLRRVLDNELPGSEIMVVSNREPYMHVRGDDGEITVQRPASGLVTAFEAVMRACGGTWIAHGSGSADRETVDENDGIAVPPGAPNYRLRRVWLDDSEMAGYYYGLANEGLWPLCHITFSRPIFRQSDWDQYVAVNRKFAEIVIAEAKRPDPVILVQDYHFALLPRMIRERLPDATIVTFWHIPWPNPEVFGVCPWREAIVDGLLGSSIIGFHTQLHCNNFIDTADRFIECHIEREDAIISVGEHSTQIRPYPISIAWPPPPLEALPPVPECRANVFHRRKLAANTVLGVGVERLDFTKGIPERLRAVELFLETYPEWVGRFVLLQAAAPSRNILPLYQEVEKEILMLVEQINSRFGREGYMPVILSVRHHEPEEVYELYRAADFCIVSSLHDGMNLVAKEFVSARDDEQGVLILSTFAGASRELMEALIVNPFDARATAETINRALHMSPGQQTERMHLMRALVRDNNVFYWAGRMLIDAARVRRRRRIETAIAVVSRRAVSR